MPVQTISQALRRVAKAIGLVVAVLSVAVMAVALALWWRSTTTHDEWFKLDEPDHFRALVSDGAWLHLFEVRRGPATVFYANLPFLHDPKYVCDGPPARDLAEELLRKNQSSVGFGLWANSSGKVEGTTYSARETQRYGISYSLPVILIGLGWSLWLIGLWKKRRLALNQAKSQAKRSEHAFRV